MLEKKQVHINLVLSEELLNKLKEEANKQELSYTALIRLILQTYLNNKNDEQK